jgi:hypothetical protein
MAITFKYEIIYRSNAGSGSIVRIYNPEGGLADYNLYIDGTFKGIFSEEFYSEELNDATYVFKVESDSQFKEESIIVKSRLDYLYDDYNYSDTFKQATVNIDNKFQIKNYSIEYSVFSDLSISTNILHLRELDGFKLDLTLPNDSSDISTDLSEEDSTGGYIFNAHEGFDKTSYVSNALNGCELVNINELDKKFIPEISCGEYTINELSQRLYSDNSITHIFKDSTEYQFESTIYYEQVTIYKRDPSFNNIPYAIYKLVETIDNDLFTYTKDNEENKIVVSEKDINLKQINQSLFDSLSNSDKVKYIKEMGENKGNGNDTKRIFYTEYFPIKNVKLLSIDSNDSITIHDSSSIKLNEYKGFVFLDTNSVVTETYYLFYDIVPRIDFEYKLENQTRSNFNLDLRPINNQNQTGVICINYEEKNIKKIKLNQEKHLEDDYLTYNPTCNIGVDSLILNAEVLNANNSPVEEIPVRFKIETLPNNDGENGYLNDSSFIDGVIDLSNNEGISRCVYYAAYRENSLLRDIISINQKNIVISANEKERTEPTFFTDEVFLYYVREISNSENFDFYTNDKDYVIFYEYNSNAYRPIKPVSILQDQENIRFEYSMPFNSSIQKEQLKLYAPKYIKITASAVDPATGQTIISNPLYIKLVFPNYLKGSLISNSQASYLGYGMPPQINDLGTGLGGANYLTINPNDIYSKMSKTITIQNK